MKPAAEPTEDGIDYKMPDCNLVCYRVDQEGQYVHQCPMLVVTGRELDCRPDCDS